MDAPKARPSLESIPRLSLAFALLRTFSSLIQRTQWSGRQLEALETSITQILHTLNTELGAGRLVESHVSHVSLEIDALQALLKEINVFVQKGLEPGFLQLLFAQDARISAIDNYHRRLCTCAVSLQIAHSLDIEWWQKRNDEARESDRRILDDRLTNIEANPVTLKEVLEVKQSNILAVMILLQKAITMQLCGERERRFFLSTLKHLTGISGEHVGDIESWMVTAFDVEFGPVIGSGGFGQVHKGIWNRMQVVLKVLRTETGVTPSLSFIRREVKTWSSLLHPHILQFLGANVFDDRPFIVIPYLKNGNARDYVNSHPGCDRTIILHHISLGLVYLHDHNVVHGDLKASNVLINDAGQAVLCDFGLSHIKNDATTRQRTSSIITRRNWMSPERILGGGLKKPVDIYAFGMTIFEIFTGHVPLGHIQYTDFIHLVVELDVRPERPEDDLPFKIPDNLWSLAESCWVKVPHDRPSAVYVCDAISSTLVSGFSTSLAQSRSTSRPHLTSSSVPEEAPPEYCSNFSVSSPGYSPILLVSPGQSSMTLVSAISGFPNTHRLPHNNSVMSPNPLSGGGRRSDQPDVPFSDTPVRSYSSSQQAYSETEDWRAIPEASDALSVTSGRSLDFTLRSTSDASSIVDDKYNPTRPLKSFDTLATGTGSPAARFSVGDPSYSSLASGVYRPSESLNQSVSTLDVYRPPHPVLMPGSIDAAGKRLADKPRGFNRMKGWFGKRPNSAREESRHHLYQDVSGFRVTPSGPMSSHCRQHISEMWSLENLIDRWIEPSLDQSEFQDMFLMIYTVFTTCPKIFKILCRRLDAIENDGGPAEVRNLKLRNTIQALLDWVSGPYMPIDPIVLSQIKDLAGTLINSPVVGSQARQIVETINRKEDDYLSPPTSPSPGDSSALLDHTPDGLAAALTSLEGSIHSRIRPADYIVHLKKHQGSNRVADAANVTRKIMFWVKQRVLLSDHITTRGKAVKFFLRTAKACRQMRNFSSMAAIIIALESDLIQCLPETLKQLTSDESKLFSRLSNLVKSEQEYRAAVSSSEDPCVLRLGYHLLDVLSVLRTCLRSSGELNRDLIDLTGCMTLADLLQDIIKFRIAPTKAESRSATLLYLMKQLDAVSVVEPDDDELHRRSHLVSAQEMSFFKSRAKGLASSGFVLA